MKTPMSIESILFMLPCAIRKRLKLRFVCNPLKRCVLRLDGLSASFRYAPLEQLEDVENKVDIRLHSGYFDLLSCFKQRVQKDRKQ